MTVRQPSSKLGTSFQGRLDRRQLMVAGGVIGLGALVPAAATSAEASTRRSSTPRLVSQLSGSVTMWVYPLIGVGTEDQDLWDSIIAEFNVDNPDVEVNVQVEPWDRRVERLTTAMTVGRGPDVWYINVEDIPNHATNDRLLPLDDVLSDEEKSDYLPRAIDSLSYLGQLWAAPTLLSIRGTVYNTDLFEEAGVEGEVVTWDELREAGAKFEQQGSYLLAFDATNPQDAFYPFIYQAGGSIFSEDGESVEFNGPEGVEALTFLVELFESGYIPRAAATAEGIPITESPLGRGEVAIGNSESSGIRQLADAWGEGVAQIGPPFRHREQVTIGTVAGWAIAQQSENIDAATAWVKHLISPDVMRQTNQATGYFAPRESVGAIHEGDPITGELEQYLSMVQPPPTHPLGREISQDAVRPELEAALLEGKDPQQALDDAAERANEMIAREG